jgi:hypothetical protein
MTMIDDQRLPPDVIPEHVSPVRWLFAQALQMPFNPLNSLEQARSYPDGIVILEGDGGGQIYVVAPARQVQCSEATLQRLLFDLDGRAWPRNELWGASIYFERQPVGATIAGGMRGGMVSETIWVHPEFVEQHLDQAIRDVIQGQRPHL